MMGHWRRLFVQLAILGTMALVNAIDSQIYIGLVSLSILILPVASWTVFALLLWTAQQAPDIQSLHDRVDDALTLALIASVAAGIGLLTFARLLGIITTPIGGIITVGLGYIVVEVSLPAVGFLRTWRDYYAPLVKRKKAAQERREAKERNESA